MELSDLLQNRNSIKIKLIQLKKETLQLGNKARERAVIRFSEQVIATAYIKIYNKILNKI